MTPNPRNALDLNALKLLVVALVFVSVGLNSGNAQENWPRFRGPNGEGISKAEHIPVSWTDKDFNWRVKLPGGGNSSPVVWGDNVFLLAADAASAKRHVVCINAKTGDTNWTKAFDSTPHRLHSRNTFASSTPAVDESHVYVAWSDPEHTNLKAFTHDGEEVWSRDFGPWVSSHGFGTSPILHNGKVILSNSQQAEKLRPGEEPGISSMIAVDCGTGDNVWVTSRVSSVASYCVPCIFRDETGKEQLICASTRDGMYSLDPETGEENWSVKDAFKMRTVASPVAGAGLLFGSTGSGGGGNYVVAVKPGDKQGDAAIKYTVDKSAGYVPTPVVFNGMIFIWYDKGIVSCVDVATGEVHWRERVEGEFSGSPVIVQDRMYCMSDTGEVFVIAADKEFKLLAVNPLGESGRSTPAVAGGKLYLRTDTHLISIGG